MGRYASMDSPTPYVVHLIPYDGIGGVETAARSMRSGDYPRFRFAVEFIFPSVPRGRRPWQIFNPLPLVRAVVRYVRRPPDVLVVSLWRAAMVGIPVKLLRPRIRLVVFIHNATDVHLADYVLTRMALALAHEAWSDSSASQQQRVPWFDASKSRVISFVTRRVQALASHPVRPRFVFWGRITAQKALDRALSIFAAIAARVPGATFCVIGPDGGSLTDLQNDVRRRNLQEQVTFIGEASFEKITEFAAGASFYLQTSLFEGMAMSVVEAMQLGLVPVVTPVGEIPSYCRDGENAVLVVSDQGVVEALLALLDSEESFQHIRRRAVETWRHTPLYADNVIAACESILAGDGGQTVPSADRSKEQ